MDIVATSTLLALFLKRRGGDGIVSTEELGLCADKLHKKDNTIMFYFSGDAVENAVDIYPFLFSRGNNGQVKRAPKSEDIYGSKYFEKSFTTNLSESAISLLSDIE